MDSAKDRVIEDIKNYISELNNHGIPVQKTILFPKLSDFST